MNKRMLSPLEICDYVEDIGISKANNKFFQTLILSILAGAFIALGAYAASAASHSISNYGLSKFVAGMVFPVGLMLVLVCGAELFTGNCLLTVAFAQKQISLKQMLKNWTIVFIGNFIGALIIVYLVYSSGLMTVNEGKLGAYAIKVAATKCSLSPNEAFTSGILCNIVVCLSVWGSYAAKDITGKVFMGFFPIMAFVISGFEHCVANMYYLIMGLMIKKNVTFVKPSHFPLLKTGKISLPNIVKNLFFVTLGNIVGGAVFIGLSYWVVYKYMPLLKINKNNISKKQSSNKVSA